MPTGDQFHTSTFGAAQIASVLLPGQVNGLRSEMKESSYPTCAPACHDLAESWRADESEKPCWPGEEGNLMKSLRSRLRCMMDLPPPLHTLWGLMIPRHLEPQQYSAVIDIPSSGAG
jgi:hypothetical protein